MNPFDAAVYLCLAVAIVMGFRSGLLRSLATIFGYLAAAPFAVATAPALTLFLGQQFMAPQLQPWPVLIVIFVIAGVIVGALLRRAVTDLVGETISIPDRLAGALLGAARVGLLAVLMVIIFDRIIPPNVQPWFLAGSQLRPILSVAGQQGLRTLPPGVADYIDRVKRARGI